MAFTDGPIRAFFGQTEGGNNHWGAWLGGLWIGLLGVVVGNIVAIIFMAPALPVITDIMAESPMPQSTMPGFVTPLFGLSTLAALILYFIRHNFKDSARNAVLWIAGLMTLISTICMIMIAKDSGGASSGDLVSQMIAASPWVYLAMLIVFPFGALGLYLAQKVLLRRPIKAMHTAAPKFRWSRLFFTMIVFWIIAGAISVLMHVTGKAPAEFVFDAERFLPYFIVSLLFIPLQSATEEIFLRGYLNQGLGRFIKSPWVVFFITSAGFAALHLGNPEVIQGELEGNKLITVSGYFFFGFFACILTYIDGGLESAIGMHAANNLFAATMLGYDHSVLPTPTVYKVGMNTNQDIIISMVGLALVCLVMYLTRKNTPGLDGPTAAITH